MTTEIATRQSWELPSALWESCQTLIPIKMSRRGRPQTANLRLILAGIFYVLRTGCQWQACPRERFGPPSTVYHYFRQWAQMGLFEQLWQKALHDYDGLQGIEWIWQALDGAMTKAPLGGELTGPNPTDRGKQGTKRSLLTDGQGIPLAVVPAAANCNDLKLLAVTLEAVVVERPQPKAEQPQNLCLDKGYDAKICHQETQEHDYQPHIRSRGEEKCQKTQHPDYKPRRWVVEVSHSWLNRFRKLLVRFEKLMDSHWALLQFACAYIVFKRTGIF